MDYSVMENLGLMIDKEPECFQYLELFNQIEDALLYDGYVIRVFMHPTDCRESMFNFIKDYMVDMEVASREVIEDRFKFYEDLYVSQGEPIFNAYEKEEYDE